MYTPCKTGLYVCRNPALSRVREIPEFCMVAEFSHKDKNTRIYWL